MFISARRVPVPDARFDYLVEYYKPVRSVTETTLCKYDFCFKKYGFLFRFNFFCSKVPAFLNVVDIAGLVKGASEGQGLGNAFLSHIKACDAIFHLCSKK